MLLADILPQCFRSFMIYSDISDEECDSWEHIVVLGNMSDGQNMSDGCAPRVGTLTDVARDTPTTDGDAPSALPPLLTTAAALPGSSSGAGYVLPPSTSDLATHSALQQGVYSSMPMSHTLTSPADVRPLQASVGGYGPGMVSASIPSTAAFMNAPVSFAPRAIHPTGVPGYNLPSHSFPPPPVPCYYPPPRMALADAGGGRLDDIPFSVDQRYPPSQDQLAQQEAWHAFLASWVSVLAYICRTLTYCSFTVSLYGCSPLLSFLYYCYDYRISAVASHNISAAPRPFLCLPVVHWTSLVAPLIVPPLRQRLLPCLVVLGVYLDLRLVHVPRVLCFPCCIVLLVIVRCYSACVSL